MNERDQELEDDFPKLKEFPYKPTSPRDPRYNCIAFAVGDVTQFWDDVGVRGYYWPPGIPGPDNLIGWTKVFEIHGYSETDDRSLEPEYEKVAIYANDDGPQHVARQKASGYWTSKMGKGIDMEHALEWIEGEFYGKVVRIMKRKCPGGRRVLE